ncbi:hypothetical protein SynPROS71_01154 [Synechococcus sp. PROS-7-1]|nr:hypothetical protein SynBMKMC1_01259 [Synechococcus sp. BMK-MC-1]QNI84960.1 hypothetical protein SynPROS71_01154 [Synechococcus sp. PROS-7-1]
MHLPLLQGLPQFSSQSRLFSVDGYEARLMRGRSAIKRWQRRCSDDHDPAMDGVT